MGGPGTALVLAACDPANAYGAALPWPDRDGHRPARKPGALVVLVDGALVYYLERGVRTLLSFTDDQGMLESAARALAETLRRGPIGRITLSKADGEHVFAAGPLREALTAAGFAMTPQGLTVRAG